MRGRFARAVPSWAILFGLACASGGSGDGLTDLPAPTESAATVSPRELAARRVLDAVGIAGLLDARAGRFTVETAYLAGELSDDELLELSTVVREEFASDRLEDDVVAYLMDRAPADVLPALEKEWSEGPSSEVLRRSDASPPTGSLDEFVASLRETPPDPERLERAEAWVDARGTGELYVLLQEALAEASYRVAEVLRPGTPPFRRRQGESLSRALQASRLAAAVDVLYRFQGVPSELLESATAFHRAEAGRWFRDEFGLALAEAVRAAGIRAAERLGAER